VIVVQNRVEILQKKVRNNGLPSKPMVQLDELRWNILFFSPAVDTFLFLWELFIENLQVQSSIQFILGIDSHIHYFILLVD
jgi:hypothetical protein